MKLLVQNKKLIDDVNPCAVNKKATAA